MSYEKKEAEGRVYRGKLNRQSSPLQQVQTRGRR